MRVLLSTLGLAVLATAGLQAQQTLRLHAPEAEFAEPFTRIASIRELSNKMVFVSDLSDKSVQLLDMTRGSATKVGREGNGPGEYALPNALIALPNDGTLLQDMLNRRFVHLGADGKPGDFLSTPTPPTTTTPVGGRGFRLGGLGAITNIRGYDARGRIYFQGLNISLEGESPDSAPIMRWDRVKPTFDTVAWIKVPKSNTQVSRGSGGARFAIRVGGNAAWPAQDQFVVAPDGRLAIVSPEPYRLTWIGDSRTAGPVVPYTPIRVTAADKKAFLDARSRATPVAIAMTAGGGGGATTRQITPDLNGEEPEWPETMPAFTGGGSVIATPEGQVWVLRTRKASEKNPTYDVFDRTGKLTGQAVLNPDSRVIGFGAGTVYVIRSDEDDLQYLQRFKR